MFNLIFLSGILIFPIHFMSENADVLHLTVVTVISINM